MYAAAAAVSAPSTVLNTERSSPTHLLATSIVFSTAPDEPHSPCTRSGTA
jgi:hypothetical protein